MELLDPFLWLNYSSHQSKVPLLFDEMRDGTSAIIIWQSKVPFPCLVVGFCTWLRILVTTGAPNVILGTKCPSIMSTCSHCMIRGVSKYSSGTAQERGEFGTCLIARSQYIPETMQQSQKRKRESLHQHLAQLCLNMLFPALRSPRREWRVR